MKISHFHKTTWAGRLAAFCLPFCIATGASANGGFYVEYGLLKGAAGDTFENAESVENPADWSAGFIIAQNPVLAIDFGFTYMSMTSQVPILYIDNSNIYNPVRAEQILESRFQGKYFHLGPRIELCSGALCVQGYARYLMGAMGLDQDRLTKSGDYDGSAPIMLSDDMGSDGVEFGGGASWHVMNNLNLGAVAGWRNLGPMYAGNTRFHGDFSTWKIGVSAVLDYDEKKDANVEWGLQGLSADLVSDAALRWDIGMLGLIDAGTDVRATWRSFDVLYANAGADAWYGLTRGGADLEPAGFGWSAQADVGVLPLKAETGSGDWLYGAAVGVRHLPLADHSGYGSYWGDLVGISAVAMAGKMKDGMLSVGLFQDPSIDAHGVDSEMRVGSLTIGGGFYWIKMAKALTGRVTYAIDLLD